MIKILLFNLILLTTLSLVNCGGAGAPTDPPSGNPAQNQTDPTATPNNDTNNPQGQDNDNELALRMKELGTYEGETDANGLFSGYGVWEFEWVMRDNKEFEGLSRYEGYFENGVPNGEGTLFVLSYFNNVETLIRGTFINGYAHGMVEWESLCFSPSVDQHTFPVVQLDMGKIVNTGTIWASCGECNMETSETAGKTSVQTVVLSPSMEPKTP